MSDDPLAQLANIKFIPPETSWSDRKAEIYPKFDYFATIVSRYVSDVQVMKELETIRTKLQS